MDLPPQESTVRGNNPNSSRACSPDHPALRRPRVPAGILSSEGSYLCWGRAMVKSHWLHGVSATLQERPLSTTAPGPGSREQAPSAPRAQLPYCLPFCCLVTRSPNYSPKRSKKCQQPIAETRKSNGTAFNLHKEDSFQFKAEGKGAASEVQPAFANINSRQPGLAGKGGSCRKWLQQSSAF